MTTLRMSGGSATLTTDPKDRLPSTNTLQRQRCRATVKALALYVSEWLCYLAVVFPLRQLTLSQKPSDNRSLFEGRL